MELDALRIFPPFCTWDTTFVNSYLFPFRKGSTLKRKNLLPWWGANSLLLEETSFQKGDKKVTRLPSLKVSQCPLMRDMHRMPMILCCTEQKQQNLWKRLVLTKTIFFLLTPKTDQELTKCCNVNFSSET